MFDEDIDRYLSFLKRNVTPQTLKHSQGMMRVMDELAKIYSLDRASAMIAGLLHDVAKDLDSERLLELAKKAGVVFNYDCECHPLYLHGPVGAYIVSKELRIIDQPILGAISRHTFYGSKAITNDSLLWCLRFADVLASTKEWKGMKKFKTVVFSGKINEAALLLCKWLIEYMQGRHTPVHPNIIKDYEKLLAKLNVDEQFFDK